MHTSARNRGSERNPRLHATSVRGIQRSENSSWHPHIHTTLLLLDSSGFPALAELHTQTKCRSGRYARRRSAGVAQDMKPNTFASSDQTAVSSIPCNTRHTSYRVVKSKVYKYVRCSPNCWGASACTHTAGQFPKSSECSIRTRNTSRLRQHPRGRI